MRVGGVDPVSRGFCGVIEVLVYQPWSPSLPKMDRVLIDLLIRQSPVFSTRI
jgi:hypothetical protein